MSDSHDNLLNMTETQRLRYDILGLMMKGAAYAALLVVAVWAFVYVIYLVGLLLPPESKEAVDPTPLSFWLDAVQALPFA
ncbi:MAG: RC-LH1 core complex protein PufX [Pseudomonadota bacterium]